MRAQPACESWSNAARPARLSTVHSPRATFALFSFLFLVVCLLVFSCLSSVCQWSFSPCRPCRNECCCNAAFCRLMGMAFLFPLKKHAILRKTNQRHACSLLNVCLLSQAMGFPPFTGVLSSRKAKSVHIKMCISDPVAGINSANAFCSVIELEPVNEAEERTNAHIHTLL